MNDETPTQKPKLGSIPIGQWSGSDATNKLRVALTAAKTEARLLSWITAFLALAVAPGAHVA